jgi:hypothetical protein
MFFGQLFFTGLLSDILNNFQQTYSTTTTTTSQVYYLYRNS